MRASKTRSTAPRCSRFAEDLRLGLPKQRFECSLQAWVFVLARNAGHRSLARDLRKRRDWVPLSQLPEPAQYAAQVRSTALSSGTPRARLLAQLRAELSLEDQELLTLRIDRELEFAEIALVTLGDAAAPAAQVTRESARLRKRFQVLRTQLRALGRAGARRRLRQDALSPLGEAYADSMAEAGSGSREPRDTALAPGPCAPA